MRRAAAGLAVALAGCMPPSVRAVDEFLVGLESEDAEQAAEHVVPEDQPGVREGVRARAVDPTSEAALALPPTPIRHYFVGIESKSEDGRRHVVLTELTLRNPLPAMSRRVGHELEGIPETRKLTMRFLSERSADGRWRVQLDLPATRARARFVQRFERELSAGRLDAAEALLEQVPEPPDNAQALKRTDRLVQTLGAELAKIRARTSSAAEGGSKDP